MSSKVRRTNPWIISLLYFNKIFLQYFGKPSSEEEIPGPKGPLPTIHHMVGGEEEEEDEEYPYGGIPIPPVRIHVIYS